MPKKSSKKQIRKLSKRYSNKRGGMFKTATKLAKRARSALNRRSFEQKLEDDITNLIDYMPLGKKEKELRQKMHLMYILSDEENKFKTMVYDISNRISMLEVTNLNKQLFLKLFIINLVKILGNNKLSQQAIKKLSAPALQSSRNNVELADAFADLYLSNASKAQNRALRNVNSRLTRTNRATAAFLDPRSLTTRTINNDFEEVIYPKQPTVSRATNVNQSKVNNLLEQAQNELQLELERSLPTPPTTKPRAKGGYRKIKKSRKRVYA